MRKLPKKMIVGAWVLVLAVAMAGWLAGLAWIAFFLFDHLL
jgi:hypothetical protein